MSTTLDCPAIATLTLISMMVACMTLMVGTDAFAESRKSSARFPEPLSWKELLEKAPSAPSRDFDPPSQSTPEADEHRSNQNLSKTASEPIQLAEGFDCKSARHTNEKLICQSAELLELDQTMTKLFNVTTALLDKNDRQELANSQRRWLKERSKCGNDFLCTRTAYVKRNDRLSLVLGRLNDKRATGLSIADCRVLDHSAPVNVRSTPNGRIVGSLPNGTLVAILDYSPQKSWVFIGRQDDRSPLGWTNGDYINCKPPIAIVSRFECHLTKQFPEHNGPKTQSCQRP